MGPRHSEANEAMDKARDLLSKAHAVKGARKEAAYWLVRYIAIAPQHPTGFLKMVAREIAGDDVHEQ